MHSNAAGEHVGITPMAGPASLSILTAQSFIYRENHGIHTKSWPWISISSHTACGVRIQRPHSILIQQYSILDQLAGQQVHIRENHEKHTNGWQHFSAFSPAALRDCMHTFFYSNGWITGYGTNE